LPDLFFNHTKDGADAGTRLLDINGDGLPDLIRLRQKTRDPIYGEVPISGNQKEVFLNTGSGFSYSNSYSASLLPIEVYFVDTDNKDLGVRMVDVNGDHLPDIVQMSRVSGDRFSVHLNTGTGFSYSGAFTSGVMSTNTFFNGAGVPDMGMRFSDINGDGLSDIIILYHPLNGDYSNNQQLRVHLNNGSGGFDHSVSYSDSLRLYVNAFFSSSAGTDMGTRLADINGDGLVDLIQLYKPLNWDYDNNSQLTNRYQGVHTQLFLPVTTLTTSKKWDLDGSFIGTTSSESIFDTAGQVTQATSCATENSFYEALVSCTAMGIATRKETTTFSYYAAEQVPHLPGLLYQKQTTASVQSTHTYQPALPASIVRFDYYLDRGLLKSETVQPGTALALTKSYTYDAKGLMLTTTLSGADITSATTTRTVDTFGRLLTEKNPLNHTTSYQYSDSRFPHLVTQITSANGIITRFNYDSFARKQNEIRADGTTLTFNRYWCANVTTCVAGELFKLAAFETNKPDVYSFYDYVGREVRKSTLGFNGVATGAWIDQTQEYDARGLLVKSSDPYYRGELINYTLATYDLLGRPITSTSADGSVNTLQYQGRTTRTTNALGQTKTVTKNIVGQDIEVLDTQNNALTYGYDTLGNLSWMRDVAGNYTYLVYNERGFKTRMLDPNQGDWRYAYFVDGQLKSQTDAKGQITQFTYDILGRMKTRVESSGTTTWTYDVGTKALGSRP
jgi:YD repeat-containing protein